MIVAIFSYVTMITIIFLSLGILGQVSADMFNKLKPVETSLRNVIKSVGNIDYETYPFCKMMS